MAFYSIITDTCISDAKRHGKLNDIYSIAEKLERDQNIGNLSSYGSGFFGKVIGREYRLIIGTEYLDEDILLILWHLFPRGDKHYEVFFNNSGAYARELKKELSGKDLKNYVKNKKESSSIYILPCLSDDEKKYLFSSIVGTDDDWSELTIVESRDWADKIKHEFKVYGSRIHEAVFHICDNINKITELREQSEYRVDDIKIIYKYLSRLDRNELFLISPIKSEQSLEIQKIKDEYAPILKSQPNELLGDLIKRKAYRAYPVDVVWDKDIWLNHIEYSDEKANMALSEEEAQILRSVHKKNREDDIKYGYPLFINGRPGSGKSTIIQYLFAEHIFYYLINKPNISPPLYLTYSEELLSSAREIVRNILKCNAKKVEKIKHINNYEIEDILQKSFISFRNFMKLLLREKYKLNENKYIDFPKFRQLFESRYLNKKISSDIAWHVIRTYIKGFYAEKEIYLTPEEYEQLPRKRKTVNHKTYREIYDNIWDSWYKKLIEEEYWDDQDLALRILLLCEEDDGNFDISKHPAIFCDEAQDFTHNELRLIYRLSLYSRRKIKHDYINKIPFAFAGDPFQTLNPTGFDWEATKAKFHEIIIQQLLPKSDRADAKNTINMNWQDLKYNYRSNKSIVQLCNLIHLIRGVLFEKKQLEPQKAYFEYASNWPVYFCIGDPICETKLKENKEIVIIIPCHEGEEKEYVVNDPFLREIGYNVSAGVITRNILSPIKAKGLEFKRIVLYKFGDEAIKKYHKLIELLDSLASDIEDPENSIPLEYYINRLYVACSRAKDRLIIADSDEGIKLFWKKYFENSNYIENLIQKYKNIEKNITWTIEDVVMLRSGESSVWETDQDSPEELAEQFFKQGYAQKDILKLSYAKENYSRANKNDKALECQAYIYEIEGKRKEAAEIYVTLNKMDKALEHFWLGKYWDEIIKYEQWKGYPEFVIAGMKKGYSSINEKIKVLEELTSLLKQDMLKLDTIWDKEITELLDSIYNDAERNSLTQYQWEGLIRNAQEFQSRGALSSAIKIIENIKVLTLPYPENLESLYKLSELDKIYQQYKMNQNISLSDRQATIVLLSILDHKDVDSAFNILRQYTTAKNTFKIIRYLISNDESRIIEYLYKLFELLIENNRWDIAYFGLIEGIHFDADPEDIKRVKEYPWGTTLDSAFIKCIASSRSLDSQDKSFKNKLSNYLREKLIANAKEYQKIINLRQAGAALERAGMVKYCLEFYELIINQERADSWKASEAEIRFAKERWLVCKKRNMELAKTDTRRREVIKEFKDMIIKWGFSEKYVDELPEYPEIIEEINNEHKKPNIKIYVPNIKLEIKYNIDSAEYEVELLKEKKSIRIINKNKRELITLNGNSFKASSDDENIENNIQIIQESDDFIIYFIPLWNISVGLRRLNDELFVDIMSGKKYESNEKKIITVGL